MFKQLVTKASQPRLSSSVAANHFTIFMFLVFSSLLIVFFGCAANQQAHLPAEHQPASMETLDTHEKRGSAFYGQGSYERTIDEWEAALQQYRIEEDIDGQCRIQLKLSEAYQAIGQFEKAGKSLKTAGKLASMLKDPVKTASAANQLGSLYLGAGLPAEATRHLQAGLDISRNIDRTDLAANILNNLGNLYSYQKNYPNAIDAYGESITLSNKNGDTALSITGMINLARAATTYGKPALAMAMLHEAFSKIESLKDSHFKATAATNVGLAFRDLQPHFPDSEEPVLSQAFHSFQAAALVAERTGDTRAYSFAMGYLGGIYENAGHYQEALQATMLALHAAQKINLPEALFKWQWQMGRLFRSAGDIGKAIQAYRGAMTTLRAIRDAQSGCYDRFNAPIRQTVENVSFGLIDLLFRRAAQSDIPDIREKYLLEARDVVELRKVYELRNYFQDDCVDAARSGITRLEDVSETAVVVYPVILNDRVVVLASFPDGLKSFRVEVGVNEIIASVRNFRKLLEKRTTRQYLPSAQNLYDWIIRPMAAHLRATPVDTLVFVPDGPFRTIPMAALHDGEHFLIEKYAVATTPGLDLVAPEPIAKKSPRILMLALTESVHEYPPLPHVADELRNIQTVFPNKLLLNEAFQVKKMETALRDQDYAILHIASHAQFENEADKTFILAYDGNVSMDDLTQYIGLLQFRDDPLELITLSACETAAGDDKAALGLAGIAVKAGARSALASLWHINDVATSMLIKTFYHGLKDPSGSKAKSLQNAQLHLLNNARFRHPGYWAPFILINNWL